MAEQFETKVQRWGNSQGVRIPKEICDAVGITVGDRIVITYDSGVVQLRPAEERPRYRATRKVNIAALLDGYDGEYRGEEWLPGAVGAEVVA
ncbi:MAG: AbrB/MazE/SpoVT family DNA-binding domain-containing protein [Atopobiaceae bacterium]|nr:AbrB/MazE/SpoVT family DNA-binding domain-containing protein [Atopobiaceae bacterium]MBR1830058.1 AbrB/MazE/SpoVT family DNA-binding domain-containing protein [Atopobiaceae bacterium]